MWGGGSHLIRIGKVWTISGGVIIHIVQIFPSESTETSPTLGGSDVEPDPSKRALGPVTELVRLGNYKIDYSRVNPQLHKLLVSKKKQNTNSFFNLLRYLSSVINSTISEA